MGIETQAIYRGKFARNVPTEKFSTEQEDPFNWIGYVEVDVLYYPTVKGTVDIDQKGSIYDIIATLTLPQGKVEIRNVLDFEVSFCSSVVRNIS